MRPKNLIAVDAHKASFTFVVYDGGELVAGPSRRPSSEKAVRELVRKYPRRVVLVEACGVHEWMTDVWLDEGSDVFVAKPFKQERVGEKSDPRDCVRLAQRYMSGELKQVAHFPPAIRLLRGIVRERCFLVQRRVQIVNHVRHALNRWNLSHFEPGQDDEEIAKRLPHLASSLALLPLITQEVEPLEKIMHEKAREIPAVQRLQTIPGFGDVVSLAFYAEIGDITRFPSAESLVKYLGLDPVHKQSGDTLVDLRRISKAGRPLLRGLLLQAAWAHINHARDSSLTHTYHRLVKHKPKSVAIIAVERRLAEIAWSVWRNDRDFTLIRPAPLAS